MPRKKEIEEKLKTVNADIGDIIRIIRNDEQHEGVLMPHHEFSDDDIITIKLKTGYNIGIAVDKKTEILLVQKQKTTEKQTKRIPYDQKNQPSPSLEPGERSPVTLIIGPVRSILPHLQRNSRSQSLKSLISVT